LRFEARNADSHSEAARERRRALLEHRRLSETNRTISHLAILLGFVPFTIFVLLGNLSIDLALWVAFAAAFAIAIRDFEHSHDVRFLDLVSMILFGLLALYVGFVQPGIPVQMARLVADGALFTISAGSLVLRHPIIRDYAREQVPKEFWTNKGFIATHYAVTAGWTLAFALMAATDAFANKFKRLPLAFDLGTCMLVLAVAAICTARYPYWLRARAARAGFARPDL